MKKFISIFYVIVVTLITLLTVYIALYDKGHNARKYPSETSVYEFTDYDIIYQPDGIQLKANYTINPDVGNVIGIYTSHQHIKVYVNNNLIYEYPMQESNLFAVSPGYSWNLIALPDDCQTLGIDVTSPYDSYKQKAPLIYAGNISSIAAKIVSNNLFSTISCIIIFVLGLVMILYWIAVRKTIPGHYNLLFLGIFALMLSIWSLNETYIIPLLYKNNIVTMYVSFTSLMLMPIPFSLFIRELYQEYDKLWNAFAILDLLQICVCVLLQAFRIKDFIHTLPITHLMYGFLTLLLIYSSVKLIRDGLNTKNTKLHLIFISICGLSLGIDLILYYQGTWGNTSISRFAFLLYCIVLGYKTIQDSSNLIENGKKASIYKQLAYTDQMTGLLNRTAFTRDFENYNNDPTNIMLIVFDLNNLKTVNDSLGHNYGDDYIISSASIIQNLFTKYGNCYRTGGDEFVAIIPNEEHINIKDTLADLEKKITSVSARKANYDLNIAYGFAIFEPSLDKNLENTLKRADQNMYDNKRKKKEQL